MYVKGLKLYFAIAFLTILGGCSLPSGDIVQKVSTIEVNVLEISLLGYSATELQLLVKAEIPEKGTTTINAVDLFLNDTCTGSSVAQTTANILSTTGVSVLVPMTGDTKFYLKTNTLTKCFSLGSYIFKHTQPSPPVVASTSPMSPSRQSFTPLLMGTSITNSVLKFYSDTTCSVQVGTGTSADFKVGGILVTLPAEVETDVYGTLTDALGLVSNCGLVTSYKHTTAGPPAPVYHHVDPVSPSHLVPNPSVVGTADTLVTNVSLFSDPLCSSLVVTGSKADFVGSGLVFNVDVNSTTSVYAVAYDADTNPSGCTYLTTYIYDTVSPSAPIFSASAPVTPTRLTIYPRFSGASSTDTALVRFYNSALCLNMIGSGTKQDFDGAGILVSVLSNSITTVYAMSVDAAGNTSPCVFMQSYKNNTIPPDSPVFGTTDPISPNNISSSPYISGNASVTTSTIDFYSDDQCQVNIGSGTSAQFDTTGIQLITPNVPLAINTTDVYSVATDPEGNTSPCQQITTYGYSTAKAANPTFFQAVPASPSRIATQPYILGTAPTTVSIVKLYTDSSCTALVGSASRAAFGTIGIQMTVPANSKNRIYALSTDVYGNDSDCTYFSEYIHDNTPPTAPTYTSANPPTPTRISATPSLRGNALINTIGKQLPTTKINFYDSFLCLTRVGFGPIADYIAGNSVVTLAENSITTIYARAVDDAGNLSACTHLVDYLHNTIPPGKPVLSSATPNSPSYSKVTVLKGSLSSSVSQLPASLVTIYRDSTCTTVVKTDSAAQFVGTGIKVELPRNTTTPVYARSFDPVGNMSICGKLLDFAHKDTGPLNLISNQNPDGSVAISWQPDSFASPTAKYILKRALKAAGPYTIIANKISSSSFRDYATTEGKTYFYVVAADNVTGTTYDSAQTSVTINAFVAVTPINLTAQTGSTSVQLTWTGDIPNLYYEVYRATQSGGPYTLVKQKLSSVGYLDESVVNNQTYFYIVKGTNTLGKTVNSNEVDVHTLDVPAAPTILSAIPFNDPLRCPSTGTGISLTWAEQDYYTRYRVLRNGTTIANVVGSSYVYCTFIASFDDGQAPPYRYIRLNLRTIWGSTGLTTPDSNTIYVSNQKITPKIEPGNNQIVLRWNSETYLTGYQIWRSTKPGWPSTDYVQLESDYNGTVFTDNSVTNGVSYYYTVIANSEVGAISMIGWPSDELAGTPGSVPAAPANLSVTKDVDSNGASLTWTAPTHFNKFYIYRSTTLGGTYDLIGLSAANSYIDIPPMAGTYYYKVVAIWGNTETAFSNAVSYRYGAVDPLTISVASNQFTLSWVVQPDVSLYRILRSTTLTGTYNLIGTTASNTFVNSTSAPVGFEIDFVNGFYYKVVPVFNDATIGQDSNIVSGIVASAPAPTGLSVVKATMDSVDLMWAFRSGVQYRIYKSTTLNGTYTYVNAVNNTNAFQVTGLDGETTYYFKVAYSSCGLSCLSDAVSAFTVSAPSAPIARPGNALVDLTWSGVPGAVQYDVLRSSDDISYSVLVSNASGGAYADTTAINGNKYLYKIRVTYSTGLTLSSLPSLAVNPGVIPLVPKNLLVSENVLGDQITLSCTPVPGASGYNLYSSTTSGGPWTFLQAGSSESGRVVSGLTEGVTYYFATTATNGTNESALSTELAVIPASRPAAPAVTVVSGSLTINWPSIVTASTYDLLRSTDGVKFITIATGLTAVPYTDMTVVSGISYFYKFLPRAADGTAMSESNLSIGVQINSPDPLNGLRLYYTDNSSVTINWTQAFSPRVAQYQVYRSTTSGSGYALLATLTAPTATYNDNSVVNGQVYYYVVTAVNFYGAESSNSNEVSVLFQNSIIDLAATANANNIDLTWSADPSALSYNVYRSYLTGGPYALLTNVGGTSYTDAAVSNGTGYSYLVRPVYTGAHPAFSNEAFEFAVQSMNLSVPVEMLDQGISSDSNPNLFQRSMTTINPADYDGTVTYELELVATNSDASPQAVELRDAVGNLMALVAVVPLTNSPTRYKVSWTPTALENDYYLGLPGTSTLEALKVFSAKIWIHQTQASRTKIYYPLLSSAQSPSLGDVFAPVESMSNVDSLYYVVQNSSIYKRNTTNLKNLSDFNAWEFEAIVSTNGSTGTVALYNISTGDAVNFTESVFDQGNPNSLQQVRSTFDDGAAQFAAANEGQNYRLAMKCVRDCDLGGLNIYKAGLWVRLQDLNKAEVFIRNSLGHSNVNTAMYAEDSRVEIDLTKFTNPVAKFVATAIVTNDSSAAGSVMLASAGSGLAADAGIASMTAVAGSTLSFNIPDQLVRQITSTPVTLMSNERYLTYIQATAGSIRLIDSFIVIDSGL